MNAFDSTITDRELRDLFKARILAADGDDFVTDKFIEMEAKLAFATPAVVFIPTGKEQELLSKLGMKSSAKLIGKVGLKWLFTGLSCATVAVATVVYKLNEDPEPKKPVVVAAVNAAPEQNDTTIVAPEIETVTTDSTKPTPAILPEIVTKPMLEQLSPFLAEALPVARITPPAMPTLPRGIAVLGILPVEPPNYFFSMGSEETDTTFVGVNQLDVDAVQSNIFVKPSPDSKVHIRTVIPTSTNKSDQEIPIYPLEYERDGSTLHVNLNSNARCGSGHDPSAAMYIEIPEGVHMALRTTSGDIEVKGQRGGHCEAESDFGNVRITDCKVPVEAVANSGYIHITDVTGNVRADASFGDITLSSVNGTINAHASSGKINGTMLRGNTTIVSDFGAVELNRVSGMLSLQATSGKVTIDSLNAPTCNIYNSFGDVTLTNVQATTMLNVDSGNITVEDLTGDLTAESAFGNVSITKMKGKLILDGSSGDTKIMYLDGNLDLESDFGNIVLVQTKGAAVITSHSGSVTGKDMELTGDMEVNLDFGNGNFQLKNNYDDLSFNLETDFGKVKVAKGGLKKEAANGSIVMNVDNSKILITGKASTGSITFD